MIDSISPQPNIWLYEMSKINGYIMYYYTLYKSLSQHNTYFLYPSNAIGIKDLFLSFQLAKFCLAWVVSLTNHKYILTYPTLMNLWYLWFWWHRQYYIKVYSCSWICNQNRYFILLNYGELPLIMFLKSLDNFYIYVSITWKLSCWN